LKPFFDNKTAVLNQAANMKTLVSQLKVRNRDFATQVFVKELVGNS
jgi:hypothetical protein